MREDASKPAVEAAERLEKPISRSVSFEDDDANGLNADVRDDNSVNDVERCR